MSTTTIRVDRETHAALLELAAERGTSLLDAARDAAEALRRQEFAKRVRAQLDGLRRDPSVWSDYLAEADVTEVADGVA